MEKLRPSDFKNVFSDDNACLDWLKNRLYPNGIVCPKCKKVTKHHKLTRRPCYCCDYCGHQVYPTFGTIFYKSSVPLKIWFNVIHKMLEPNDHISIKDIQRNYHLTYKTAWRMVGKIKEFVQNNTSNQNIAVNTNESNKYFDNIRGEKGKFAIRDYTPNTNSRGNSSSSLVGPLNRKGDRVARLIRVQMLLCQNPQGLRAEEISHICSVSKRTAYRDLRALEYELNIPIWQDGNKRGIPAGSFLTPINITLTEAAHVYLAERLMFNFFHTLDPSVASIFMKLNAIVPAPLFNEIQRTLEYLKRQPRDMRKINNFNTLINAWLSRHKVKIIARSSNEEESVERIVDPYIIEPSAIGGYSYIIAFCNLRKGIYAFNIEHIVGNVEILPETFEIPEDFNAIDFLDTAWGILTDQEIQTVKLHFNPKISRIISEESLHSSQINEVLPDGSIIMTLKVHDYFHILHWTLKWGDEVEVLEPQTLRGRIVEFAQSIVNKYKSCDQVVTS